MFIVTNPQMAEEGNIGFVLGGREGGSEGVREGGRQTGRQRAWNVPRDSCLG